MKKTLVILAHPHLNDGSIANRLIAERLAETPGITVHKLHAMYPDFKIDVAAEQQALIEADTVVFQFPFYWYSVPGILKFWMDEVLTHGFAYGSTGKALNGKDFMISVTIGGPVESYTPESFNTYPIEDLLHPLKQTSNLTGMNYLPPVVSHSMVFTEGIYGVKEKVIADAKAHAERLIEALR